MDGVQLTVLLTLLLTAIVSAFEEVPKFSQLTLLYPGYHLYGGQYRDNEIADLVGRKDSETARRFDSLHNTASLRLSFALNRYGGRHALPRGVPVLLSKHGRDSVTGDDGLEYIFRNTAFGPFLAGKYGNPQLVKARDVTKDAQDTTNSSESILDKFMHRQGIIRMVNYNHHHAAGHVGLWDCDHFVQSRDWSHDIELIAVEFWESPDSYCPRPQTVTPNTASVTLDMSQVEIVVGHNIPTQQQNEQHGKRKHRRHRGKGRSRQEESIWIQQP